MPKLLPSVFPLVGLVVFLCITMPASAQTLTAVEKDLVDAYAPISSYFYENWDSLAYYSKQFDQKIAIALEKYPETFKYPFPEFKKHGFVATSTDGVFRIYSWDTWLGGTAHIFNNLIQYETGGKIQFSTIEGGYGFYPVVFTLKTKTKTYYLANGHGIFSTRDSGQSLEAYTIEKGQLLPVELFKNRAKLSHSISIEFDFFSVVERPERPLKLIKYDEVKKIIYVPVIGKEGAVTELFTQYRFNGKYFEAIN